LKETQASKKSIIRNVILLFGLLIAAIIGNGIYATIKTDKFISEHTYQDLHTKLNMVLSIQNNEMDKLRIVSAIVTEQRQEYCHFIDYDNIAAITSMLKTLARIHSIDLAFIFDEYGNLLTAYPRGTRLENLSIYGGLISIRKERVDVEKMSAEIVTKQIPAFKLKSDEAHILCFKSVIRLLSDVGDIYAYVVLINLINGNHKLADQMAHIGKAEIVYYDQADNMVLSSFKEPIVSYPEGGKISLNGKTYLTSMEVIRDFSGLAIGKLVLALDSQPFLKQRMRMFLNNLLPLLLSAIICVALFVLLKLRVFNRIEQLIVALRSVRRGKGDLSIRLGATPENSKENPPDEVEQIFIDFDHMMKELEDTNQKMIEARKGIEKSNRRLETRVKERTSQLLKMNEALKQEIEERKHAEKERTKLESQLARAEKMEAIGTLAGGVAHDLNNILGGLVSYPEMILMDIPRDSPLRKPILTIQKSGERAAAIVQDLLTLARRGVAVTKVVNLNHVIAEYMKSLEFENLKSRHPGVAIKADLEADILNILGSYTHLSKCVMNLISNAAEAITVKGSVLVCTENRYMDRPVKGYDSVKEGDYVVLTVSDTGVGLAPEDMDRIFEPFYTKKQMGRSGTGLGMSVVWGTVKDHNGYIDIHSREGKGTTFTLYFPATRREITGRETELDTIDRYMGHGESILVVDDVEEQRDIACDMLKKLGYNATSVSSGEAAVEYLKRNKIDLLVLDMIMDPGMDGLDTYRKILELHPGQKAIIASGFSETERVKETQRLGAGAYIRKPFLLEKIGHAVKDTLGK
jgi:signal transduction histidine kinase